METLMNFRQKTRICHGSVALFHKIGFCASVSSCMKPNPLSFSFLCSLPLFLCSREVTHSFANLGVAMPANILRSFRGKKIFFNEIQTTTEWTLHFQAINSLSFIPGHMVPIQDHRCPRGLPGLPASTRGRPPCCPLQLRGWREDRLARQGTAGEGLWLTDFLVHSHLGCICLKTSGVSGYTRVTGDGRFREYPASEVFAPSVLVFLTTPFPELNKPITHWIPIHLLRAHLHHHQIHRSFPNLPIKAKGPFLFFQQFSACEVLITFKYLGNQPVVNSSRAGLCLIHLCIHAPSHAHPWTLPHVHPCAFEQDTWALSIALQPSSTTCL